jgi:hypothetical protein
MREIVNTIEHSAKNAIAQTAHSFFANAQSQRSKNKRAIS